MPLENLREDIDISKITNTLHDFKVYGGILQQAYKDVFGAKKLNRVQAIEVYKNVLEYLSKVSVPYGMLSRHRNVLSETQRALYSIEDGVKPSKIRNFLLIQLLETVSEKMNTLKDRIKAIKEGTDFRLEVENKEFKNVLDKTSREVNESAINKAKDRRWMVVRAPVIPIVAGGILNANILKKYFKVSVLDGYPVLHNQLCLAVNRTKIKETPSEYAKEIIDMLSAQRGVKYMLVCPKPTFANNTKNVSWYWLMTRQEINNMSFAYSNKGGSILVVDWGFANAD